ncbi:MAG: hypothetical protein ACW98Y_06030 [Candidatus Thorarchaeota archaeon]|jgi:tetratricopeptide (TPR) repeat protein
MDPIGTITQYFPFLDDESRNLMQSIMDDAANYHDFVMRLKEQVLSGGVPDFVVYFAIHHSALLLDMESIQAVGEKYGKMLILRPNLFYARVFQGNTEDAVKVHESADAILATIPPTWFEIETRFLKFEIDLLLYPTVMYDSKNLDILEELFHSSSEFDFFKAFFFDFLREKASRDGNRDEIDRYTDLAIEYAVEHDDIVRLAYLLRVKSSTLRSRSILEAKDAVLKSKNLMERLGNKAGVASTLLYLARLDATRGEYNLAIEHLSNAIRIREIMDLSRGPHAALLSSLYNMIGDPKAGLEWARYAEIDFDNHPGVQIHAVINQIWSLILLKKLTEAAILLDSIREPIFKSGMDTMLAWFNFVTGLYEIEEGNIKSARKNLEDAIEIYEGKVALEYGLIFLYHLAMLDVRENLLGEKQMPWLTLLESKAKSDDLPGIMGLVHLLKAEVAIFQNDEISLRNEVERIRFLGKNPSMAFLNSCFNHLLV